MQSDVICWFLLTLFIGVFADKKEVEQNSLVLLFENVTADNADKDVSLFVNGVRNPSLIATFKYVNGYISTLWKADNYKKIFMDAKRNIRIANIDETYERKFYIQSSKKLGEVELTISKTNYSATVRTALNENTQKGDALPETSYSTTERTPQKETTQKGDALPGYAIALIILVVIVILMFIIIMVKKYIIAWIQCKKSNSVLQPVQIASPCDSAHSTSYLLIWNKPADEYQLQKYILRYREIKPILREHDNIPASTVSYTLSPLTPGRCYQVEIQAINTQGHSCSNYFNFRTKENETNSKFPRVSKNIERLLPRNNDTVPTDKESTSKAEQKENRKSKKRPEEKQESLDSDSDSDSNDEQDALLKDSTGQNF